MLHYVRRMTREDIEQVSKIDREAFPTEWPPINFKRELENRMARYVVACYATELPAEPQDVPPQNGLIQRVSRLRRLFSQDRAIDSAAQTNNRERIKGFLGFWIMADEAHITSIATGRDFRRQGIGELLIQAVLDMSIRRKARIVTLEVRISNTTAQQLYTKYGFNQVGLRRGYYTDNREDALIMSTDHINSAEFQAQLNELKKAYAAKWGPNRYLLAK